MTFSKIEFLPPPFFARDNRQNTKVIFGISFLCVTAINLAYLILVAFPGNMSSDSIVQFEQIQNDSYSNHHPYYHTKLIELFYSIGMKLFAENSAAIATYTVFQIIMIGIIFSYAVTTLYEIGISKKYCYLAIASFSLYPIHWSLSSNLWKDTIWSWIVTAWLVTFFRCRKSIGNTKVNLLILFLTSVGFCILRSNGIYAFVLILCVILLYFIKKEKKIIYTTFAAFALSFILTRPVLAYLNVPQPLSLESLAIPIQQIARVIYDDGEITDSEKALIEEIVTFEFTKAYYVPHTVDTMKSVICNVGQYNIINEKKDEFLKVWVNIGVRYPFEYIKAWVDETRGYWNIDDNYIYVCFENIDNNDYGIARHGLSDRAAEITSRLIESYNTNAIMGVFISAGSLTWLYLCLFLFNIISGRSAYLEQIPLLAIVFTLLIAAPVCNLFRYSYVLFTSLPFAFAIGIKPE